MALKKTKKRASTKQETGTITVSEEKLAEILREMFYAPQVNRTFWYMSTPVDAAKKIIAACQKAA